MLGYGNSFPQIEAQLWEVEANTQAGAQTVEEEEGLGEEIGDGGVRKGDVKEYKRGNKKKSLVCVSPGLAGPVCSSSPVVP